MEVTRRKNTELILSIREEERRQGRDVEREKWRDRDEWRDMGERRF